MPMTESGQDIENLNGPGRSVLPGRLLFAAAVISFFSLAVISAGCNKKPEYIPGSSVQGYRAPIYRILFSPLAYDGRLVAVEGIVNRLEIDTEHPEGPTTFFRLIDLKGNYINVEMPGTWDLEDDDYIVVGGIYRKNGSYVEAEQYERIVLEQDKKDEEIKKRDNWP
ncbi:MAG TPA: hypothetical protein PKC29_02665 [Thermodesulfobacteriota bacterium]|nr:hypothetical protein [Thermodesulfobacteriota bacterium]